MVLVWTETTPWLTAALLAALLLVLSVHFRFCFRALRPRRYTLEWIDFLDRPAPQFVSAYAPITRSDVFWMLFCAVAAAGLQVQVLRLEAGPGFLRHASTPDILYFALYYLVSPAACVAAFYCIARQLTTHATVPLFATALLTFDLSYDTQVLPFLLLALAFFLRWWRVSQTASFGRCTLELLAATAYLAVGAYFAPSVLFYAAVLFVPLAFAAIWRAVHRAERGRIARTLAALLGYWLMLALWTVLTRIPGAMLAYSLHFWQVLLDVRFWQSLALWLVQSLRLVLLEAVPVYGIVETVLQIYAAFCAAACVYLAVRHGDLTAALLVWLYIAALIGWLFGLAPAALGCLPVCALVWDRWLARGTKRAPMLGIAALLAVRMAGSILLLLSLGTA